MKERAVGRLLPALGMLLPLAAVGLVARNFAFVSTPDLLPLWAAVPIGLGLGVLAVFVLTVISGTDVMDLLVSSAQVVLLSLLLMPTLARAKAHRLRHKHHTPHAQVRETQTP